MTTEVMNVAKVSHTFSMVSQYNILQGETQDVTFNCFAYHSLSLSLMSLLHMKTTRIQGTIAEEKQICKKIPSQL